MNQRIQELLEEAHRQTKGGIYSGHPAEWSEKFAELIVEECIVIMNREIDQEESKEKNRIISDMMDLLEQHFGVEP